MLDIIAQTTTQATAAAGTVYDPWRWIPWALAAFFGFLNLWQWFRNRRRIVQVRFHKRYFLVDVTNWGVDLFDVMAILYYRKDGRELQSVLGFNGELPKPLKLAQSWRYWLSNDFPRRSLGIEDLPASDVWLVIVSGTTPIKTVKGKRLRAALDAWSKPDPTLPDPPQPQESVSPFPDWLANRPKW